MKRPVLFKTQKSHPDVFQIIFMVVGPEYKHDFLLLVVVHHRHFIAVFPGLKDIQIVVAEMNEIGPMPEIAEIASGFMDAQDHT